MATATAALLTAAKFLAVANPQRPMTIRRAILEDVDRIARVHVAAWQDNYRGLIPAPIMEERTVERRQALWRRVLNEGTALVFVAEDSGAVAGFASAILLTPPVEGFDAYLQAIYLRSESKLRGIGRALVRAVAAALHQRGCANLVLRTLRFGDARNFYERLGARLVPDGFSLDAGTFDDVVYAFDDISRLLTR